MSVKDLVPLAELRRSIFFVRGHWVMLDSDLAHVYAVKTERLNEQVRRNAKRFPANRAFRLTREEYQSLIPQIAGSKLPRRGRGGPRKLPWVFTDRGAIMAATVLRNDRAVEMCARVVDAFVRVSRAATVDRRILERIEELERRSRQHGDQFQAVFAALRKLLSTAPKAKRPIGFLPPPESPPAK